MLSAPWGLQRWWEGRGDVFLKPFGEIHGAGWNQLSVCGREYQGGVR